MTLERADMNKVSSKSWFPINKLICTSVFAILDFQLFNFILHAVRDEKFYPYKTFSHYKTDWIISKHLVLGRKCIPDMSVSCWAISFCEWGGLPMHGLIHVTSLASILQPVISLVYSFLYDDFLCSSTTGLWPRYAFHLISNCSISL